MADGGVNHGGLAVRAERLGKRYVIGRKERNTAPTLRDSLGESFRQFLGNAKAMTRGAALVQGLREDFWALRNVSFSLPHGRSLGVIGRNGAGKSTLLKILSQITEPTEGRALLRGRAASLLEVGTGFHPELTGRENIFLNGAILGMTRAEIRKRYDAIVDFSGVEKFLDTPVKRYSSGMYVRLAFAVAAHLEPEILIVDEVLAVGDAEFQRRCLGRMQEVSRGGRTVIFVSHNLAAVSSLCDHAILLDQGQLKAEGPASSIVDRYASTATGGTAGWAPNPENPREATYLRAARMIDSSGGPRGAISYEEPFAAEIQFNAPKADTDFAVYVRVSDARGNDVFASRDTDAGPREPKTRIGGAYTLRCEIPRRLLRPGAYTATAMLETFEAGRREHFETGDWTFLVTEEGFEIEASRWGVIAPVLPWRLEEGPEPEQSPAQEAAALR